MIEQYLARQQRHDMALVPPLADEFTVYGGPDIVWQAKAWALENRYVLITGVPRCAHGLYLMASCPHGMCRSNFPQLDHVNLWLPTYDCGRPFLLSHPYADEISRETRSYAAAHGLVIEQGGLDDGWYSAGTIPVRMELPQNWPLWPIEALAAVLLATQPIAWPNHDEVMAWWQASSRDQDGDVIRR